jgi:hypothetical protein
MGKYDKLGAYLRAQTMDEVPMRFAEIERVIGDKLPPRAQFHRAWWSNNPSNNVMTKVWRDAGFKTERVDAKAGTVVFKRVEEAKKETALATQQPPGMAEGAREFNPAEPDGEKKPYRHPLFGSMKGTFTLVPSDDSEPPPEDPESWEALTLAKFDRLLFGKGE